MIKFLFWCTGAGEFAHVKTLYDYVVAKGDTALLVLDNDTMRILDQQEKALYKPIVYDLRQPDPIGRVLVTVSTYKPDVFVMQPTRAWQTQIKTRPEAKLCLTVEANLQFRGVGVSFIMDEVFPSWLDYYLVAYDEPLFDAAMEEYYGTTAMPAKLAAKVKPIGWIAPQLKRDPKDYIFIYIGGGMTNNPGLLNRIVKVIPKSERIVAISQDSVFGHYPNLALAPYIKNYDQTLIDAKVAILHEGFGSISKCLVNGTPFISVRGNDIIKQLEIDPLKKVGYGHVITRDQVETDLLGKLKVAMAEQPTKKQVGLDKFYEFVQYNI